MGKCPSCGKKKIFLEKVTCNACGKVGCVECFTFLFHVLTSGALEDTWYSCSENCFEKIAAQIENQINPKEIIADFNLPPIGFFVGRVVLKQYIPQVSSGVIGQIKNRLQKKEYYVSFNKYYDPDGRPTSILWNRLVRYTKLIQAKHFETLREIENAAKIYKSLGMYQKAGNVRAKRDELSVRRTDVTLNLNALLKQIKEGGIVAVYLCPNCGGKLKVGSKTTLKSLRTCEHCESEIEAMDLADFLKTALS
jgi:uncharacterized protein (DUF983 family)